MFQLTLPSDRIKGLNHVNFPWRSQEFKWQMHYKKLVESHHQGLCIVHRTCCLGKWVNNQRQSKQNGKLPTKRIRLLDALGFAWSLNGHSVLNSTLTLDHTAQGGAREWTVVNSLRLLIEYINKCSSNLHQSSWPNYDLRFFHHCLALDPSPCHLLLSSVWHIDIVVINHCATTEMIGMMATQNVLCTTIPWRMITTTTIHTITHPTVRLTSIDHPLFEGAYFLASRRGMTLLFSLYHPPLSEAWYKLKMELIAWAEAEI